MQPLQPHHEQPQRQPNNGAPSTAATLQRWTQQVIREGQDRSIAERIPVLLHYLDRERNSLSRTSLLQTLESMAYWQKTYKAVPAHRLWNKLLESYQSAESNEPPLKAATALQLVKLGLKLKMPPCDYWNTVLLPRLTKGDALARLTVNDLILLSSQTPLDLSKRIRKQRHEASLPQLLTLLQNCSKDATTSYTLLQELLHRFYDPASEDLTDPLPPSQVARILRHCRHVFLGPDDKLVPLLQHWLSDTDWSLATPKDVSFTLQTVGKWHLQPLPTRLVEDVHWSRSTPPHHLLTTLRNAVLLYEPHQLESFGSTIAPILREKSYLQQLSLRQLANVAWCAQKAKWKDAEFGQIWAQTVLCSKQPCSGQAASRMLLAMVVNDGFVTVEHRAQVMEKLGRYLLSNDLKPMDVSSAMYAYAKAEYWSDITIFGYLLHLQARHLERYSVRQVAQSLWACAKMIGVNGDALLVPPFYGNTQRLAAHLADRAEILSTKDTAQTLWALAKLGVEDPEIVTPLAKQANNLSDWLNAQEISNIFWALSKVGSKDYATVFALTQRVCGDDAPPFQAKEAASIVYALGRMNIREEQAFQKLSAIVMEQIDTASAQAVANVMWAHNAVHIQPPQALLDSWAIEKLGIVAVQPRKGIVP